jgi:hypothetical protein
MLKDQGIHHKTTFSYTFKQNGDAECWRVGPLSLGGISVKGGGMLIYSDDGEHVKLPN